MVMMPEAEEGFWGDSERNEIVDRAMLQRLKRAQRIYNLWVPEEVGADYRAIVGIARMLGDYYGE